MKIGTEYAFCCMVVSGDKRHLKIRRDDKV